MTRERRLNWIWRCRQIVFDEESCVIHSTQLFHKNPVVYCTTVRRTYPISNSVTNDGHARMTVGGRVKRTQKFVVVLHQSTATCSTRTRVYSFIYMPLSARQRRSVLGSIFAIGFQIIINSAKPAIRDHDESHAFILRPRNLRRRLFLGHPSRRCQSSR